MRDPRTNESNTWTRDSHSSFLRGTVCLLELSKFASWILSIPSLSLKTHLWESQFMIFQKSNKKTNAYFCAMKKIVFSPRKLAISGIFKRYFQDVIIIYLSMAAVSPLLLTHILWYSWIVSHKRSFGICGIIFSLCTDDPRVIPSCKVCLLHMHVHQSSICDSNLRAQ